LKLALCKREAWNDRIEERDYLEDLRATNEDVDELLKLEIPQGGPELERI